MDTDPNRTEHCLERRCAQRFEVSLPLAIHFDGRTVHGFAQDLSGRGIFFYAETALPEGAVVELTFTMPAEITLGESMPVRCRGRVLRAGAAQAGHAQDGHSARRATKRNRRAARCLRVLARRRVQHPLRAGFERNRGRSNFRPVAGWSLLPENSFFCKFLCKFASSFQALAFALQSIKPAVWRDVCSG